MPGKTGAWGWRMSGERFTAVLDCPDCEHRWLWHEELYIISIQPDFVMLPFHSFDFGIQWIQWIELLRGGLSSPGPPFVQNACEVILFVITGVKGEGYRFLFINKQFCRARIYKRRRGLENHWFQKILLFCWDEIQKSEYSVASLWWVWSRRVFSLIILPVLWVLVIILKSVLRREMGWPVVSSRVLNFKALC